MERTQLIVIPSNKMKNNIQSKENYWKKTEMRKIAFLIELNKKTELTNKQLDKLLLKYNVDFKDIVVEMIQSGWIDRTTKSGKIELRRIK